MLVQITKSMHICQNKIFPATSFDEILIGERKVRGYIAFEHHEGRNIAHVLHSYEAVEVPDMLQVVQGEFAGRIGIPTECKFDATCAYYNKPSPVYLLDCGDSACWVPVSFCRKHVEPKTWIDRIKSLCGLE